MLPRTLAFLHFPQSQWKEKQILRVLARHRSVSCTPSAPFQSSTVTVSGLSVGFLLVSFTQRFWGLSCRMFCPRWQ